MHDNYKQEFKKSLYMYVDKNNNLIENNNINKNPNNFHESFHYHYIWEYTGQPTTIRSK